jgi:structural maintenance of chromosome 3 (chondroitin sulfate proteoglycan 6)
MKKDEYSIDRKNATKKDVQSLLDTAGFSRSNPYYIVPQGRITALTNMKDSERLDLLKSVAGTEVYEEKKAESVKIMNETTNKLSAIDGAFEQINQRLSELEEEQEELRSFQDQDRERRGLEYTLYHREQEEINKVLIAEEDKRAMGIDDADEFRERFGQGEDELAGINQQIEALRRQMIAAKLDKKQLDDDRREKAKARAQVDLEVRNLTEGQSAAQKSKQRRDAGLQKARKDIAQHERELGKIVPQYTVEKNKEDGIKGQLEKAEADRQRLYAKQGRNARFRNKKERDDWLDGQINGTIASLSTIKAVQMQTADEVKELQGNIKSIESEIDNLQGQIGGHGTTLSHLNQEIQAAVEREEKLQDDRRLLWRKDNQLDTDLRTAQDELRKAEQSLSHMMDGNTSRGIESVRRIKAQHNLQGCYGTLAELIQVDQHKTAVEVVAGNSLFHYVVDNDDTATRVMNILNKERGGRVTFMPLNRLKPKVPNFPNAQDVKPLMSLIKYEKRYERAVEQVFGKSIICQNLTVAAQYARTHGVNAVTPDGDRSDKKGALTGGYYDHRRSRLAAVKNVMDWREKYEAAKTERDNLRKQLDKMDQTVTKAVGETQKLEHQRNRAQNDHGPLRQELKSKLDLQQNLKDRLDTKQKQEANIAANVKNLSDQQSAYQAEKASEFKKALTAAEETQLENLNVTVQDLNRQYAALSASRSEIEVRKRVLEVELNENLRPLLEQLEAAELETAELNSSNRLKDQQRLLERLNKDFDGIQQRLTEIEESIETSTTKVAQQEAQAAEIRRNQEDLAKAIERHQRRLEKSTQKKAALQARKQDLVDSIRDLGAVTDEMKTKFRNHTSDLIVKRLHKVNDSLKKYTSVNKHAFEHYRKSVKQREELENRRKELESSKKSIEELIDVLDMRKDEAIERTFKQVSKNFAAVFEKLVPAGRGRLVIQRRMDKRTQAEDEEEEDHDDRRDKEGVENYTGVGISVSFNSKHDEQQRIQQLSGGQKSIVPLYREVP